MLVSYAAPVAANALSMSLLGSIAPALYAREFGVPLATIGGILLLVRLIDAGSDSLIGYWSDRWRSRGGDRRVLVSLGAGLMTLGVWLLANPPAMQREWAFACATLTMYLAVGLFDVPHYTLGGEIATGYADRARIYGARAVAMSFGGFLLFVIPLLPGQVSTAMTLTTMRQVAWLVVVAFAIGLTLLWRLPVAKVHRDNAPQGITAHGVLRAVLRSKPLLGFLLAFFGTALSAGMFGGLMFLYVDTYLGFSERVAAVFALGTPMAIVATPFWSRLAARTGKRNAWFASAIALALLFAGFGFIEPGSHAFPLLLAMTLALFAVNAAQGVIGPAILADIADYGRWKFQQDAAASNFAGFSVVAKATAAFGGAAGLALAGASGFDPSAPEVSAQAARALKLAIAWIPAVIVLATLPLIWKTPITERRLKAIQQRVARRDARGA